MYKKIIAPTGRPRQSIIGKAGQLSRAWREKHKGYDRRYYSKNRETILAGRIPYRNEYQRIENTRLRNEMLTEYGGKCVCCGERAFEFLTLGHIFNDGKQERMFLGSGKPASTTRLIQQLKVAGWPKKRHQLECWNCNCSKAFYGQCPHRASQNLAVQIKKKEGRSVLTAVHPMYTVQYHKKETDQLAIIRKKYGSSYQAEYRWKIRLEMIAAYGGRCACCQESTPQFLTLEHKNGGGLAERLLLGNGVKSGFRIILTLRNKGWPKNNYTVLCYNCNCGKGKKPVCQHKK